MNAPPPRAEIIIPSCARLAGVYDYYKKFNNDYLVANVPPSIIKVSPTT